MAKTAYKWGGTNYILTKWDDVFFLLNEELKHPQNPQHHKITNWLVVSTHLQKYESKWVHLPHIEVNIKKIEVATT